MVLVFWMLLQPGAEGFTEDGFEGCFLVGTAELVHALALDHAGDLAHDWEDHVLAVKLVRGFDQEHQFRRGNDLLHLHCADLFRSSHVLGGLVRFELQNAGLFAKPNRSEKTEHSDYQVKRRSASSTIAPVVGSDLLIKRSFAPVSAASCGTVSDLP